MELNYSQFSNLMNRYPKFELSYETDSQKGELNLYDTCVAIPTGKKAFLWNTFHNDKDVCYLLDVNRDKKISRATVIHNCYIHPLSHNTIVYGTIVIDEEKIDAKPFFVIEDIYFYNGIHMKNVSYLSKLSYMKKYIEHTNINDFSDFPYVLSIPCIWKHNGNDSNELPFVIEEKNSLLIGYTPHHLQYRSLLHIMPYINVTINRKLNLTAAQITPTLMTSVQSFYRARYTMDFNKPQYKYNTNFLVKADLQNDIYHLFAYGSRKSMVYYGIMYIPDYKTSVMMNSIYRNIKENANLDAIEESDDEEDFQDISPEKYVDLNKIMSFDCKFHRKFKKWYPIVVSPSQTKIVHINKLVRDYY